MQKKILNLLIICIAMGILCACGSANITSLNEEKTNESIIDLFYGKDKAKREYAKSILKTDVGSIKIGEFEFSIDELIYDTCSGIGIYSMTITSEKTDMNSFETYHGGVYAFVNSQYKIQISDGTQIGPIDDIDNIEELYAKIVSKNEIKIYSGYINQTPEFGEKDELQITVRNEEKEDPDTKNEVGKIELPLMKNSVKIMVNEDCYVWISGFGMKEYFLVDNDIIGNAKEVFLAFNDGSKIVICDENYDIGYLGTSGAHKGSRIRDFSEVIDINEIQYLSIDDKKYEVSKIAEVPNGQ